MDELPAHLMNADRMAWASSIGLAQRLPHAAKAPEIDYAREELIRAGILAPDGEAVSPDAPSPRTLVPRAVQLVGEPITGRDWVVLQLPGGQVRGMGDEATAREKARVLATAEAGSFAVLQPRAIVQPQTTVTEEAL